MEREQDFGAAALPDEHVFGGIKVRIFKASMRSCHAPLPLKMASATTRSGYGPKFHTRPSALQDHLVPSFTERDRELLTLRHPFNAHHNIGTFDRSSRFEAHLDTTGFSLTLERVGDSDTRKTVHLHLNYGLVAEILQDVARTVAKVPADDIAHREALTEAAAALHKALSSAQ